MSIINVRRPTAVGIEHLRRGRNGAIPDALGMASLAAQVNMLAGRRKKVLWDAGGMVGTPLTPAAGTSTIWRGYFRTGPNPRAVVAHIITLGSSTAYATSGQSMQIHVGPPGALVSQPVIYLSAGGVTPNDARYIERVLMDGSGNDLVGNTVYEIKVDSNEGARPVGIVVYERSSDQLSTTSHVCVPQDVWVTGGPIVDSHYADILDTLWTLYAQNGTHHARWTNHDTTPPTCNSATFANVIDGSTAAWSSSDAGFWYYPEGRGTLSSDGVDCVFWCIASTDTGSTGQVRFVDSSGTLATITGIGTTLQVYTATGTIDASVTSDLCIIQHADSTPNTITTYAAGFYEYTT